VIKLLGQIARTQHKWVPLSWVEIPVADFAMQHFEWSHLKWWVCFWNNFHTKCT